MTAPGESATLRPDTTTSNPAAEDIWIPNFCYTCNHGPCITKVHRVDGVVVGIAGNLDGDNFESLTRNQGAICPKAYGHIQKIYNPNRLKTPLRRTNPDKSPGADPGWVEISWEDALDTIAQRLKEVRQRDPRRLLAMFSRHHGPHFGTFLALMNAFGPVPHASGGASIRCYVAQHIFANLIHGGFACDPDLSHCNYLLVLGYDSATSGGVGESMQYATARARGMKVVVLDPVLTPSAVKADEWIPIKPGTDGAFLLALINVIIYELRTIDIPFLKNSTNSPYLVGETGYFLRDSRSNKALLWDLSDGRAKTFDDDSLKDPALEGSFSVEGQAAKPVFQVLKEHIAQYPPDWASRITDVPAATIRRLAKEFADNAGIGSTITLDGITLPYRPVSTKLGRGVHGIMYAYQSVLADHILAALVGSLEAVGGHCGGRAVRATEGGSHRGLVPGPDGMLKMDAFEFAWPPKSWDAAETFTPYSKIYGRPYHLLYKHLADAGGLPMPEPPEMIMRCRANPLLSIGQPDIVREAIKKVPFLVSIAYVMDEVTEMADIVIPDLTDLERYELTAAGRISAAKRFDYVALKQPVTKPTGDIREISDVMTELAARAGFLDDYNVAINNYFGLTGEYRLGPGKKYDWLDIVDRWCKSATKGAHGLEWFKEHGALLRPVSVGKQYEMHLGMTKNKLRYPIPYMEHVKVTGETLARNLRSVGIDWWDTSGYVPLPIYIPPAADSASKEYDFYVTVSRSMLFGHGSNVDIPWLIEVADGSGRDVRILMNRAAASARGIKDGDQVWVESPVGKVKQKVKLTEGIRPDTLVIGGQFGQWATPVARDTRRVSQTSLTPISYECTDPITGGIQGTVVKAKVFKAQGETL